MTLIKIQLLKLLCILTTFALITVASVSVGAQDGNAEADDDGIETVVVTGSRIPQKRNLTSSSPVTEVGAEDFILQGTVRVEDLLNDLPQTFAAQTSGTSNGATGTATVDLRGLGAVRTLVLVNGKRVVAGSPQQGGSGSDLNQIPDFLVKKVEVLTGGASAVYGSDAIAGVVNFLYKDDLQGAMFDYQYTEYQHNNSNSAIQALVTARGFDLPAANVKDGGIETYSFAFGTDVEGGRGHVTGFATYREAEAIVQGNRDFSACALNTTNTGCGGSSTTPQGTIRDFGVLNGVFNATVAPEVIADIGQTAYDALTATMGVTPAMAMANLATLNAHRTRVAAIVGARDSTSLGLLGPTSSFDLAVADSSTNFRDRDGTLYNFAPGNYYQRPDERLVVGSYGTYDISDYVTAYMEVAYTRDETVAQVAPSGAFFVTEDLSCGNPLISEQQFQRICGQFGLTRANSFSDLQTTAGLVDTPLIFIGRRNVEGGFRRDSLLHTSFKVIFGLKGEFADVWSYDISYNTAQSDLTQVYENDLSATNIVRALDVVTDTRAGSSTNGQPICRSVLNGSDPTCVPWNIFVNNGNQLVDSVSDGVTQAALDYLTLPLYSSGYTTLSQLNAYVVADLAEYGVKFPAAENGVSVSFGVEQINQSLVNRPDNGYLSGDGAGQGGPQQAIQGSLGVDEYFFETRIPIIEGASLAESLVFDFGFRVGDYTSGRSTTSFKAAVGWALSDVIKLRASVQQASRHASLRELFRPQSLQLTDAEDPCATATPTATAAECARSGVSAAQYGNIAASPAGQYNELAGGNPNVLPEESDTLTFGVIFTPLDNLDITIDYFDIDLNGAIAGFGFQTILNGCVNDNNEEYCSFINRGAGGTLWLGTDHIVNLPINTGFELRSGFDISVGYTLDLGSAGSLAFNAVSTILESLDSQAAPGAPVNACVGLWAGECGSPNPEVTTNLRVTWSSPTSLVISAHFRSISAVEGRHTLAAVNYLDLAGTYTYKDVTFKLGANNLLDVDPPLAGNPPSGGTSGNGNTYPGIYDALGMRVFAGVSVKF